MNVCGILIATQGGERVKHATPNITLNNANNTNVANITTLAMHVVKNILCSI